MFVCMFWTVMLAMSLGQRHDRAKAVLMVFMLVATILYFGHHVFFMHQTGLLPWSDTAYVGANLAVYPLYLIYILQLTTRSVRRYWHLCWLLPSLVGMVTVGVLYSRMSAADLDVFICEYLYFGHTSTLEGMPYVQAVVHDVCKVVFAIEIVPVLFVGRRQIRRFDIRVLSNYSDVEDKMLTHMHTLLIFFVITAAISFASNIVGRHRFDEPGSLLIVLPSVTFSVLLFALGYVGYMQNFGIKELEEETLIDDDEPLPVVKPRHHRPQRVRHRMPVLPSVESRHEQAAGANDATGSPAEKPTAGEAPAMIDVDGHDDEYDVVALRQRLDTLMVEKQFYLTPNLKLADLVKQLHSNRNYVYNVINRDMGVSFSEYVNRLRLKHALRLMEEQPTLAHNEVAELSGFASMTSFYRNFKLYMGCSPKEYQNKLNQPS